MDLSISIYPPMTSEQSNELLHDDTHITTHRNMGNQEDIWSLSYSSEIWYHHGPLLCVKTKSCKDSIGDTFQKYQNYRTCIYPPEMCNLVDRIKGFFNILNWKKAINVQTNPGVFTLIEEGYWIHYCYLLKIDIYIHFPLTSYKHPSH